MLTTSSRGDNDWDVAFWGTGVRVHFLSFFDTSGPVAPRIAASRHKDAGNPEDHDAGDNLSW
jgi:hypothetical protein